MLVTSAASLFATTLLLSTTTTAAPTRTHCRCTVVVDAPPPAIYSPSVAHWTPAESSPSPVAAEDICSNLGPQLEHFQHAKSDLYESYLSRTEGQSREHGEQRPLTTKVLLNFADHHGLRARRHDASTSEPRPTSRPHQRIVCRSEPDPFTAYQGSFKTLWALQIIIAFAILACLAEGVHRSLQWYGTSFGLSQHHDSQALGGMGGLMRLPGHKRLMLEIFRSSADDLAVLPDEKVRTHEATPILIVQAPNGERVCISYQEGDDDEDEDDDDEINRPVM